MASHSSLSTTKDVRFWGIMVAICIATLLSGLETTVVTTSLPTIVRELKINDGYIWITNALFLTSAAVQPVCGQLADIFGRRRLALSIVTIYIFGSALCGGATTGGMLITGRAIQGVGIGGLNMILDVIVSDLVPLRERGAYIAFTLVALMIGTALGPFIGGVMVQHGLWRWVFYINLPAGGVSLILLSVFLQVGNPNKDTLWEKLKRIDYVGNLVLLTSTTAILYALTYAGARFSWSSPIILAPLLLGFAGIVAFYLYERSGWPKEPMTPVRLFVGRTAIVVSINTLLAAILLYWTIFFLSVYFQGVLESSPTRAGVQMLPAVLVAVPGAIVAVLVLTKTGRYKPLHAIGYAFVTLGLGLLSVLTSKSHAAEWIIYQILAAIGSSMILNTQLPAFQACVSEKDQAVATASWAFIRSFGCIFGVTVPAAIFNNRFQALSYLIADDTVRFQLADGRAYGYASREYLMQLDETTRAQVIDVFTQALRTIWLVSVAFSGLAFLLVFLEREISLRTNLDTKYGLEEQTRTAERLPSFEQP